MTSERQAELGAKRNLQTGDPLNSVGVFFSPGFIDNVGGAVTFIGDSLSGPGVSTDGTLSSIFFK